MFKNNSGFTLVELIVVIAILAILAGVAVPAYSAYITNANETADKAELAAVNTAVASAMSFEGKNLANVADYFLAEVEDGVLTISPVVEEGEDSNAVFDKYEEFGGETSIELKAFESLDAIYEENILNFTFGTSADAEGE